MKPSDFTASPGVFKKRKKQGEAKAGEKRTGLHGMPTASVLRARRVRACLLQIWQKRAWRAGVAGLEAKDGRGVEKWTKESRNKLTRSFV